MNRLKIKKQSVHLIKFIDLKGWLVQHYNFSISLPLEIFEEGDSWVFIQLDR